MAKNVILSEQEKAEKMITQMTWLVNHNDPDHLVSESQDALSPDSPHTFSCDLQIAVAAHA